MKLGNANNKQCCKRNDFIIYDQRIGNELE